MTSVPKPLTSVEVRWFISAADPPDALGDWIAADWSADSKRSPNEETRTDSYLVTADAGVSFVYGAPVTYFSEVGNPNFAPANFGPSVQFSLIGATTPTISNGSVCPSQVSPTMA